MAVEIESLEELDALLASGNSLRGARMQDLDVTDREAALLGCRDLSGLVVFGGRMSDRLATHLREHGAIIFPSDPGTPVDVYRAHLYSPDDLYAGLAAGYPATTDARAYAWSRDANLAGDVYVSALKALHDDSMSDALDEALIGTRPVGIMGGHAVKRGEETYARTAQLGHRLAAAGLTVVTGGGPGAMEAANLGAIAGDSSAVEMACERLTQVPSFAPEVGPWAHLALDVRAELLSTRPAGAGASTPQSIGIPTWFYGHEPPNVFADGIAKHFSNAVREDGLLSRCTAGILVMSGAAGTVQEIFQALTPLYYAATDRPLPPLVLIGREHWTQTIPVWPAMQALASGRPMEGAIHLVDGPDEAVDIVTR